jgi:folate-binding protein YgfZ
MKPEWKAFLANNGAEFDDDHVAHFGAPDLELRAAIGGHVICDLSHFGLIAAYGRDAEGLLQGQLTNDVRKVSLGRSQLSACCNPKGRMIANFRLFRRGETLYLRLPRSLLETVLERLQMFVLQSEVTLEDASDALVRVGLGGAQADGELADALGPVPGEVDEVVEAQGVTAVRVPGADRLRYELYGELAAMEKLWEGLNVNCAPVGADAWSLCDILAGIPTVYPATSEAFVPQMANMQLINGVAFDKGCYTGQEVIARMQYLGQLKRRLYLGRAEQGSAVPGDPVYPCGADQAAGTVVDARPDPDGGIALLQVAQIERAAHGPLCLGGPDGAPVTLLDLPYPVEPPGAG